ncbi:hypothetical protein NZK32_14765 [Cyanobium sp. FGCU-52]|nr:hypothetical protein [Cyanobium sp. FGCU52]
MNAGRPGHEPGHRPLRGIPRSRAFWELNAEQMMNRLFEPDEPLDLDTPADAAPEPARLQSVPRPQQESTPSRRRRAASPQTPRPASPLRASLREQPWLLAAALGGVGLVSALVSALYLTQWNRMQQALTQERNLLLLERLRSFGPATPAAAPPAPATPAAPVLPPPAGTAAAGLENLPPPPPEEPWMQQLSQLPGGGAPAAIPAPAAAAAPGRSAAPLLRVPVSPPLAAALRRAPTRPAAASGPVPVLVGVVAAPGQAGSAIFQVGSLSTSAGVGETISGTSWRLRSASADSAVIERDGEQRTVVIGNGG